MTVLVTGPAGAGTADLLAVLRAELPQTTFTDTAADEGADAPTVVIFVVSAAAPMTPSDIAILHRAAARTDAVIAVLAKVDRCRNWRQVLTDNQVLLAGSAQRYRAVVWTTAAAAPDIGPPEVEEVVSALTATLADDDLVRRNRLRARADELHRELAVLDQSRDTAALSAVRARRAELLERYRGRRGSDMADIRAGYQQARVRLANDITAGCARLRAELQECAGAVPHRGAAAFADIVTQRIGTLAAEVGITAVPEIDCVAASLGIPAPNVAPLEPPAVGPAPVRAAGLENRLMTLLAAGFGLGVAVAVGRVLVGITRGVGVAVPVASVLTGIAVMVWVIRTRGLLRDRALLDRWVGEVIATVRPTLLGAVTAQLMAAESAGVHQLAERLRAEDTELRRQLALLDDRLRRGEHRAARAAAEWDRRAPALRRSLTDIEDRLRRNMSG